MTFSDILADIYADIGLASSPPSAEIARIKRYVNEGLRIVLGEPGIQRLIDSDSPLTVASVADQARYVVPEGISLIRGIHERTNDRVLKLMTLDEYRKLDPDPSESGTPSHYVPIGRVGVAVQPSDASSIFVDSTAAGDTGTAYLEGLITGGYRRTTSVTMTGTTAVNMASTISTFIELEDFYISANAVGTVTLHEDASGGTELARITIGQKRPRYFAFYLWPTPSAVVSYLVDYRRSIVELANDTDEPPLPEDFHYLLTAYARSRAFGKSDDTRAEWALGEFQRGLSKLRYAVQSANGEVLNLRGGPSRRLGWSMLGPDYPAGS